MQTNIYGKSMYKENVACTYTRIIYFLKRKEALPFEMTCVYLQDMMLQLQEEKYLMMTLPWGVWKSQADRGAESGCQGLGRERNEMMHQCLMIKVCLTQDEEVLGICYIT